VKVVGTGLAAVAVWLFAASSAGAAFPGANGLLAVQPLHGNGIVLVADGAAPRRICTNVAVCGRPVRPRFSPDGRSIVFAGPAVRLIGTDGSCQNCRFGRALNPAFVWGRAAVSFVSGAGLVEDGIDGLRGATPATPGGVSDAVWSASGTLAVVARGRIWAGRPGALRQLGLGTAPSWSPDGSRLAIVRGGWVTVLQVAGGRGRALAPGTAPAFSPDGRLIAYIDSGHHVRVVSSSGGRSRVVRGVRGIAVDWQPLPTKPAPCVPPPGSAVLARSDQSVVTTDRSAKPGLSGPFSAAMGCLFADGRERLLAQSPLDAEGSTLYALAAVAGTYAALDAFTDQHYGPDPSTVLVFDLRTGQKSGFGGEQTTCDNSVAMCNRIDGLVVGADGVSAVHVCQQTPSTCATEQIIASDRSGVRTLDSSAQSGAGAGPQLTGLSLSGHTLSWSHRGSPMSAQLTP
jgi:hypothetical protein